MESFVLFLVALLIIFVFWWNIPKVIWTYYKLCKTVALIPGWPTHWLYGNLHQKSRMGYTVENCKWIMENNYPITRDWIGPTIVQINVNHPDIIKEILNLPKSQWVYRTVLEPWLGQGLLLASGKRWARNRRLITGAFHFDILKPYIQVYNECTDILINKWTGYVTSGEPVLVYKTISQLTLDILLRCSFSYNSHCQEQGDSVPYIKAVKSLSYIGIVRYSSVFLSALNNSVYLYLTPTGRKYKKALNVVHRHAEDVIQERKQVLGLDNPQRQSKLNIEDVLSTAQKGRKYLDFLDILLTARDEDGCGLTDLEIRCEVDTFMFEGHDTTAHALSWTLCCLAKYPEHQEKCREEINEVLGNRDYLEYEDLSKLQYTQWCIKEALRLYPPVYTVYRTFTEDGKLNECLIPKGCLVAIKVFNIHHNPKYWKNPYVFDPLRFHPNNSLNQHPYAYLPFSAGPRNCIGQNFAMNEVRVVIASIIRKFRLSLVEEHNIIMVAKILLTMENDIKLWLEPVNG